MPIRNFKWCFFGTGLKSFKYTWIGWCKEYKERLWVVQVDHAHVSPCKLGAHSWQCLLSAVPRKRNRIGNRFSSYGVPLFGIRNWRRSPRHHRAPGVIRSWSLLCRVRPNRLHLLLFIHQLVLHGTPKEVSVLWTSFPKVVFDGDIPPIFLDEPRSINKPRIVKHRAPGWSCNRRAHWFHDLGAVRLSGFGRRSFSR